VAVGYCDRSVFEEIQGRDYQGSYDAVKRFVNPLRKEAFPEATVRFETPPGRQAHLWEVVERERVLDPSSRQQTASGKRLP